MASQAASLQAESVLPIKVSSPILFSLYGVIPVCLFLFLLDITVLEGKLVGAFLPVTPGEWAFWAIVFNFPHIVSSLMTLIDKEYWSFYKTKLIKAFVGFSAFVLTITYLVPALASPLINTVVQALFFTFFATYTMHHVLSQQFGIGMMMMRVTQTRRYELWRVTATIATTCLYFLVFARDPLAKIVISGIAAADILKVASLVMVIVSTGIAATLISQSKRQLGTLYCLANVLMLWVTWGFMMMDYTVFVILIPRFIHDLTAFIIYSTHDRNRNLTDKPNLLYRYMQWLPLSPLILCPLLAIAIANGIEQSTQWVDSQLSVAGLPPFLQISVQIIFIASFMHYYIESFVWKRESIHRHHVGFT
ncbi:MAG: hypothetical protein OXE99_07840 [Cellvibrionales bacterium]|nr:hypothetical protein [Cellvibrionales bacterium]